jgi:hypothetical protein
MTGGFAPLEPHFSGGFSATDLTDRGAGLQQLIAKIDGGK